MKFPGKEAYETQWQIIQKLVAEAPLPGDPMPQMDPMTGMPVLDPMGQPVMVPGPMKPSVEVLPIEDHPPMFAALVDFMYSEEGRALRAIPDSPGWQNFMIYAMARQQIMMPPPMPPPGAPAGGGGELEPSMSQAPNEANAAMAANQTAGLQ
jgi:hypothetical protein